MPYTFYPLKVNSAGRQLPARLFFALTQSAFPFVTPWQEVALMSAVPMVQTIGQAPEIIHVDTDVVGCDGGGGPLGHPRVFLSLATGGTADCPYCGRRYVQSQGAQPRADH
jgi:uncharacterized Zn-finger protein